MIKSSRDPSRWSQSLRDELLAGRTAGLESLTLTHRLYP